MTIIDNIADSALEFLKKSGAVEQETTYKTKCYPRVTNWLFSAYRTETEECVVEPTLVHRAEIGQILPQDNNPRFPNTTLIFNDEEAHRPDLVAFFGNFYDPNLPVFRRNNNYDVKITRVDEYGNLKLEILLPNCFPRSINYGGFIDDNTLEVDLIHNNPIFKEIFKEL